MNVANHSYWNLDGTADWAGHRLQVAADRYLPTTDDFTPTGEIVDVAGTAYDFRAGRRIARSEPPLDNNFCLSDGRVALRDVLWLTGEGGVAMTVATTEPGIQIYDGRNAIRPGHGAYEGLAIEAQGWPDAPNHAGFPSIALGPDETYQQVTEWRFARP
jgi:aldose 1-epimerase